MTAHGWVRLAGPVIGMGLFLGITASVGGMAGLGGGMAAFIIASALGERYWRSKASPEDLRRDLEDRAHNPPS